MPDISKKSEHLFFIISNNDMSLFLYSSLFIISSISSTIEVSSPPVKRSSSNLSSVSFKSPIALLAFLISVLSLVSDISTSFVDTLFFFIVYVVSLSVILTACLSIIIGIEYSDNL